MSEARQDQPDDQDQHNQGHGDPGPGNDDNEGREIEISLNGRRVTVTDVVLKFEEILRLIPDYDPNFLYRVTYEKAASSPESGTLTTGQKIKVKKGTIIHATPTDKS